MEPMHQRFVEPQRKTADVVIPSPMQEPGSPSLFSASQTSSCIPRMTDDAFQRKRLTRHLLAAQSPGAGGGNAFTSAGSAISWRP